MPAEFNAFISYSRTDSRVASRIERMLEWYRIPRQYRNGKSRFSIFRDTEDANLGELSEVFQTALDSSDFLVVLCSPASRDSKYVNEEIRCFCKSNDCSKIIPILIDGRPNTEVTPNDAIQDQAFPPALLEYFDEPIAADFRPRKNESWRSRLIRLRESKFQVIAKLLHTNKSEELVGREVVKRRLIISVISLVLLGSLGFGSWSYYDHIPKPGISFSGISATTDQGVRIRDRIKRLRAARNREIPSRTNDEELLVATWNMRNFGSARNGNLRGQEPSAYLAEIISCFDLVGLQELTGDSKTFEEQLAVIQHRLGPHWKTVVSGVSEGSAGNRERLGFLYDSRKVVFANFTDEVVLPGGILTRFEMEDQIARTPFMAGFLFRDIRLQVCNVHIYFGDNTGPRLVRRVKERESIATHLRNVSDTGRGWSDHLILLGNFQTRSPSDDAFRMFESNGFDFPAGGRLLPTYYKKEGHYDQIATLFPTDSAKLFPVSSGVFDFYEIVYQGADETIYTSEMAVDSPQMPHTRQYDNWRLNQMTDHLPKWVLFSTKPN